MMFFLLKGPDFERLQSRLERNQVSVVGLRLEHWASAAAFYFWHGESLLNWDFITFSHELKDNPTSLELIGPNQGPSAYSNILMSNYIFTEGTYIAL